MNDNESSRDSRVASNLENAALLFRNKNSDYRAAYILSTDIMQILVPDKSMINTRAKAVIYHNMTTMVTKLIRASSLIFGNKEQKIKSESVQDTFMDLSVYSAMAAEVSYDSDNINKGDC